MSKKDNEKNDNLVKIYAKAILRGIILSLILLLITSAVLYLGQIGDEHYRTITWVIMIVSICYSAIYAALRIGKRGFLHGALIGVIFILIMMLVAYLTEKGAISIRNYMVLFLMSIVIGALAGMIGMVIKGSD